MILNLEIVVHIQQKFGPAVHRHSTRRAMIMHSAIQFQVQPEEPPTRHLFRSFRNPSRFVPILFRIYPRCP